MVRQYVFGTPIETGAIVNREGVMVFDGMEAVEKGTLPFFKYAKTLKPYGNDELPGFFYEMAKEEVVYGLGETLRGMNKRGWHYVSSCADDPVHSEDKVSLYGAHNLLLIAGKKPVAVFVDYPGEVTFDVGYTHYDQLMIVPRDMNLSLYVIEENSLSELAGTFRHMIGLSYIPPKWAFGYGQSRWSYMSAEEVRDVVKNHREHHIPLDSVYLDIDYMERYKDFTINEERFPAFESFVEEMKKEHIHLVPIIDAGVKVEDGYDVYEEGKEKGYFCKDEEGNDFTCGVWPGKVHLPDMLNADARKWFGNHYAFLLEKGIDGFWNDMNEPALFYSEKCLNEAIDEIASMKGQNLDLDKFFHLKDVVLSLSNNPQDYKSFYHNMDGQKIRHDKVHNLYGYNMTKAAGEAFGRLSPEKRILMFSRSSYVGMHRYGGIWTGDNMSNFSHILLCLQQLPAIQMCGFLYTGPDLGGFGSNTSEELLMRFLALGIFTPLMRNHSALGTRRQEAYQFDRVEEIAGLISIRYALLPYLYSTYMKAALGEKPYFQPLSFVYPEDEQAYKVEDQLMLGEELMIAPVYVQNATGRYVYLPEDMALIRIKSTGEMSAEPMENGHHYVDVAVDEVVFFLRKNRMFPLAEKAEYVEGVDGQSLRFVAYGENVEPFGYYTDDGYCTDYTTDRIKKLVIKDGRITDEVGNQETGMSLMRQV